MKCKALLILILLCQHIEAQHAVTPDSLKGRNYSFYKEHISLNAADKGLTALYAKAWLHKAKSEGNCLELGLAYRAVMFISDTGLNFKYADSILIAAKRCNDNAAIGAAYMTKAIAHYERKEMVEALDNYLLADQYVTRTTDRYLIHKLKYGIGLTKYQLGFYDEAIALFRECTSYFEEENDRAYLNSLHMLGYPSTA